LLVVAGGFAQVYVIIVGGQAYPLLLFPGMEVSSSFFDGVISGYRPSLPELTLGFGGIALAALITLVGLRVLPFLPDEIGASRPADSTDASSLGAAGA
jgi:molybdopterin-containing oxidoreductase family membrane subunit